MHNKLEVKYLLPKDIIPYKNNPRIHKKRQIEQIVNSIKSFDFTNPIIVDEDNIVLCGHGRLLAAEKLQLDNVPVITLKHLSENQKKALLFQSPSDTREIAKV